MTDKVKYRTDSKGVKVKLTFDSDRLKNRSCTLDDVISVLEPIKKFKLKSSNNTVTLELVDELDSAAVATLRTKIL